MSQINFKDETLDASDGVTKLLLAAEYWKEKASALRAELDALNRQEPVAWMKDQWSPDCGIYWELCREDEMGWRDRKDWVPLYASPVPAPSLPDERAAFDAWRHDGAWCRADDAGEWEAWQARAKLAAAPKPEETSPASASAT